MGVQPTQIFTAGMLVRCRVSFTNRDLTDYELGQFQLNGSLPAGVGTDPLAVSATVRKPDGSEFTAGCVRSATGSYFYDVDTTGLKGHWVVHLFSQAGAQGQGAAEAKFVTELDV